jgi:hypothetical protein
MHLSAVFDLHGNHRVEALSTKVFAKIRLVDRADLPLLFWPCDVTNISTEAHLSPLLKMVADNVMPVYVDVVPTAPISGDDGLGFSMYAGPTAVTRGSAGVLRIAVWSERGAHSWSAVGR